MSVTVVEFNATVGELSAKLAVLEEAAGGAAMAADLDATWVILAGALVFFMQAGFGMLEAGTVSEKNVINIMFKNLMDATIAAIVFAMFGYAFAYGDAEDGSFIGTSNFFLMNEAEDASGLHSFFFQWTFSAAAATIVSGSVAERCKLDAYFVYSIFLTGFVYPVVVHWVWDTEGWLCAWGPTPFMSDHRDGPGGSNSMVDFAGCSVVHMVGGFAGLVAAILIGPRQGRFDGHREYPPHNMLEASLGVLILWFGWYGFNCGSTLMVSGGASAIAARAATTTTLAAAAGCLTCTLVGRMLNKNYDIGLALNGILAGLVSITAGCAYINPWGSVGAGAIGGLIYMGTSKMLKKLKIDDPLDAFPIHGCCGAWGALAVGIFGTDENVLHVLGYNNDCIASGLQFAIQLIGVLVIALWTVVLSLVLFGAIKATIGLRVSKEIEFQGLDLSEHGAAAYNRKAEDAVKTADHVVVPVEKNGTQAQ